MPTKKTDIPSESIPVVDPAPETVTAEAAQSPPSAEILTAEQWADKKGMTPQFKPVAAPFAPAGTPPTMEHNPSFWRFSATRVGMGWPIGKELTEAEFDAAVEQATSQTYR